ncbi:hypothetical protein [Deinococcus maricopensis]|uniref:hypothetical protein n=1 Tax=Deinococcus maricopensis TaxID=309887 RepID=UPI0006943061|nr:hypothetical protein [Deinococcus maricopensis]
MTVVLLVGALTNASAAGPDAAYAWGSEAFVALERTSEAATNAPQADFTAWFSAAYARTPAARLPGWPTLDGALSARRAALAAERDLARRAALARETAAWLHHTVKVIIPKFSLTQGFEFTNAVRYGTRQCLLQSVVLAALMQRVGLDAGIAMVWKNERGQESNLGHVVTVLRLPGGRDVLVDASDPQPFMRHQGLLVRVPRGGGHAYRFVAPRYASDGSITAYVDPSGRAVPPAQVGWLDGAYVRSQFEYYRGERAPGGFMGPSTPAGLNASAQHLRRAAQESAQNPLAALVLAHVERKQGQLVAARAQYVRAANLYRAAGHVPAGVRAALAWAQGQTQEQGQ